MGHFAVNGQNSLKAWLWSSPSRVLIALSLFCHGLRLTLCWFLNF